jgi:hypothetical protein
MRALACALRREGAWCNPRLRPSACTSWMPRANRTWDALPGGLTLSELVQEILSPTNASPDTPPAAARARIQFVVYHLNLTARRGDAFADEGLKLLAHRRDVVSACCVGCGAVRKLKTCSRCRIARFCDAECTARMWPAHKASCKAWRAESAGPAAKAEQS